MGQKKEETKKKKKGKITRKSLNTHMFTCKGIHIQTVHTYIRSVININE